MPDEKQVKMLTISEAAARIGVHQNTLRRWADNEIVPYVKLPSGYRRWTEEQIAQIRQDMGLRNDNRNAATE